MIRLALLATLFATPAFAAPPPVGSDDWNLLAPHSKWVQSQHDSLGRSCCGEGDGRPVQAEIRGDSWWVHIDPKHWADAPERQTTPGPSTLAPVPLQDHWEAVPDEKVTHSANPTGVPVLWLYHGRIQCFSPPDES